MKLEIRLYGAIREAAPRVPGSVEGGFDSLADLLFALNRDHGTKFSLGEKGALLDVGGEKLQVVLAVDSKVVSPRELESPRDLKTGAVISIMPPFSGG
ncbi:MAG: MoaD/ThiS family protein [Promethearchaeota archaeon]